MNKVFTPYHCSQIPIEGVTPQTTVTLAHETRVDPFNKLPVPLFHVFPNNITIQLRDLPQGSYPTYVFASDTNYTTKVESMDRAVVAENLAKDIRYIHSGDGRVFGIVVVPVNEPGRKI